MGFSAKTISELNYFEQMNNVIHAMKEIKDEPRKEQLKKLLGFDNETLFGFRLAHNEIEYTIENPTYPRYKKGGCIAKPGSCNKGLRSEPSILGGNSLEKGFEVIKTKRLIRKIRLF